MSALNWALYKRILHFPPLMGNKSDVWIFLGQEYLIDFVPSILFDGIWQPRV